MARIRGAVLEEIVQQYLLNQGYEEIGDKDPKFDITTSNAIGRGTQHEIDAFGQYRYSVPFVFPIRLLAESKCYAAQPVGVDIIREVITVRKDVNENYDGSGSNKPSNRRTECVAVFSTSGFSDDARDLAFAHGVYLVPMAHATGLVYEIMKQKSPDSVREARRLTKSYLEEGRPSSTVYFGTVNGATPISLVGESLPVEAFEETDNLTVMLTLEESDVAGVSRFNVTSEQYEWDAQIEVMTEVGEALNRGHPSIYVPVEIDGIQRFLNLDVQSNPETLDNYR